MSDDDEAVDARSGALATKQPVPEQADDARLAGENTDVVDGLVRDLNKVRAEQSKLWAEEFGRRNNAPTTPYSIMSTQELDRRDERRKLSDREDELMAAIREQRGGM